MSSIPHFLLSFLSSLLHLSLLLSAPSLFWVFKTLAVTLETRLASASGAGIKDLKASTITTQLSSLLA